MNSHSNPAAVIWILVPNLIIFLGSKCLRRTDEVRNEPIINPQELSINSKLNWVLDSPPTSMINTGELEMYNIRQLKAMLPITVYVMNILCSNNRL